MKYLFDTSVLIAAYFERHPAHRRSYPYLRRAEDGDVEAIVATHGLAELFNGATRGTNGNPVSPNEAVSKLIGHLTEIARTVELTVTDYESVLARMVDLREGRALVYDALHAQAALKEEVDGILTLNPSDFQRLGSDVASLIVVPEG